MAHATIKVSDTFEQSTCGVCGCCEINQYFTINDNFIEYSGVFLSLREVLKEALDLKVDTKALEICLDCKDKVIKFYHFKRKAHDVHKRKNFRPGREKPRRKEKKSKIVQNIVQIVENYTEKCSVTTIKVDENSRKLIIEPKLQQQAPSATVTSHRIKSSTTPTNTNDSNHENEELLDEMFVETPNFDTSENIMADPVHIKQEEEVFGEPINYIDPSDASNMQDMEDEDNDDSNSYQDPDYSYNYGASTSSQAYTAPAAKKRKTDTHKSSTDAPPPPNSLNPSLNHKTRGRARGKYRNYTYEDLERAKEAIANGASLTKTAIALGIPYNTLYSFKGKIAPTRKQMKLLSTLGSLNSLPPPWHQPEATLQFSD